MRSFRSSWGADSTFSGSFLRGMYTGRRSCISFSILNMREISGFIANLLSGFPFRVVDLDSAQDRAIVAIIKLQTRRASIVENTRVLRPQYSFVLSGGT